MSLRPDPRTGAQTKKPIDFFGTKLVDSVSPLLFQICAFGGGPFKSFTLDAVRREGAKKLVWYTLEAKNAILSGYTRGRPHRDPDANPLENLAFSVEEVSFKLSPEAKKAQEAWNK